NSESSEAGEWSLGHKPEFGTKAVLAAFGIASVVIILSIVACWGNVGRSSPARDRLISWFDQIDGPRGEEAREAIQRMGRSVVPRLLQLARMEAAPRDTVSYVLSLVGPEVVPDLIQSCGDPDESVREAAVGALILIGPQSSDVVQAVSGMLEDPSPTLRFL